MNKIKEICDHQAMLKIGSLKMLWDEKSVILKMVTLRKHKAVRKKYILCISLKGDLIIIINLTL